MVDAIKNGEIQLVFNTTEGRRRLSDSRSLRRAALLHKVPYYTTLAGAIAAAEGIKAYLERRSRGPRAAGILRLSRLTASRRPAEASTQVLSYDREGAGNAAGRAISFGTRRDDGQGSDHDRGLRGARGRTQAPPAGRAPAHHPGDLRSARASATCRRTPNTTPPRRRSPSTRAASLELESLISRAEIIDVTKLSGDRSSSARP